MNPKFATAIRNYIFKINARGKPFSTRDLMGHFGWTDRQSESMRRVLRDLVRDGEIFRISAPSVKPSKGVSIEYSNVRPQEKFDMHPITLYKLRLERTALQALRVLPKKKKAA